MREIIFRGKRVDNGKWIEGYYQKRYDLLGNEEHLIFHADSYKVWEYAEVAPETLCEFTGRCVRFGRMILSNIISGKSMLQSNMDVIKIVSILRKQNTSDFMWIGQTINA